MLASPAPCVGEHVFAVGVSLIWCAPRRESFQVAARSENATAAEKKPKQKRSR
jgi:hypothetical protein